MSFIVLTYTIPDENGEDSQNRAVAILPEETISKITCAGHGQMVHCVEGDVRGTHGRPLGNISSYHVPDASSLVYVTEMHNALEVAGQMAEKQRERGSLARTANIPPRKPKELTPVQQMAEKAGS